ncbi:hypothetical protein QQP08_021875 [Theobroma cacao]|nr:hypothetical protein QQP08_021875 [Theobroma cacao]
MKTEEFISKFFSRTITIINKMRVHGEKMENMTDSVCAIEESKDLDDLSIDELQGSLLVHEQKLSYQDKGEQALKAFRNNSSLTLNRSD